MFWAADIHESVSPSVRQGIVQQALKDRVIPAALHYETPRQAQKWLELHKAFSPAHREEGGAANYRHASGRLAAQLPAREVVVIGLGCGSGFKDRLLVQACLDCGLTVHYAPVDISLPLVLSAARAVQPLIQARGGKLFPLVCDLTAEEDWRSWWQPKVPSGAVGVITFYGLLPTLPPREVQQVLARWLAPDSWLLLSANLIPQPGHAVSLQQVLPQYDNEPTRQWLGLLLEDLGVPGEAGRLHFQVEILSGCPSVWAIVANWQCLQPLDLVVGEIPFHFEAMARLRLFSSFRYTTSQVEELLQPLGQTRVESWLDSTGEEGVFLCVGRQGRILPNRF
ncbi:MAG: L-histidine N(alpha)-methyltransferase [Verrucomicrobiae bacterium]|nr:L-histidine N(alpha)-methyltransferase [Verrucomicrobiae bacterium]